MQVEVVKLSSCVPPDHLTQALRCPVPPLGITALVNSICGVPLLLISRSQVGRCLKGIQATEQIITAEVMSDVIEGSINDCGSTKEGLHPVERMPKQLLDGRTDKWADGRTNGWVDGWMDG